ncbi:MAG: ion transporter [Lachnospiraceae bacterium]|nr:ion transporter [Lachnospiraceae bacterium]
MKKGGYEAVKKRVSDIIEVGYVEDFVGRAYDIFNLGAILINLAASVLMTYSDINSRYGGLLNKLEAYSVAFFAIDYILRLWTSSYLFPDRSKAAALLRYAFSFNGLVDMLSCMPYYLPVFFPGGMAAFRIFRVMRIFRIFRINAYFDSLNVIGEVLKNKSKLLVSSVFVVAMLMLASSLCMYSLEHEVQPEVFDNALSGLWWASATLMTVGYGDMYPITAAGRAFGIIITMLGVGMVAIPTGIISAGFVEQYEKLRKMSEEEVEKRIQFIKVEVDEDDEWKGKTIKELGLPNDVIVAAVSRNGEIFTPNGKLVLENGDVVALAADTMEGKELKIELKEVELKEQHEWNGMKIKDLNISRQTFIVSVKRGDKTLIPHGGLTLRAGDNVVLYTKQKKS